MTRDVAPYAIRLGDDALVLSQRLIEWTSNAPLLEEELALANTALDYLGRARLFYQCAGSIVGQTADELAFRRDVRAFTNLLICELPRGDFAFSMARQFLLDAFQLPFLEALCDSSHEVLRAIAAKAVKESRYHLKRSRDWVLRLGDGTAESHTRVQRAFDALAGYTDELFEMDGLERGLALQGIAVDRSTLRPVWEACVEQTLAEATLVGATGTWRVSGGRLGVHTEHLGHLLAELQFMQRAYPGFAW
jgi:ring-1,2-phenylacetyl-CoA epoxidase subunit PaaC